VESRIPSQDPPVEGVHGLLDPLRHLDDVGARVRGDVAPGLAVEEAQREEGLSKAQAVFRLYTRKLKYWGLDELPREQIVREGDKAEKITHKLHLVFKHQW